MEEAIRAVLENATPTGNGDYLVPGWAFRELWAACGSPELTAKDAIFGECPDRSDHAM